VLSGERVVAVGIAKLGVRTKFCHVSVAREFEEKNLGELIFTSFASRARCAKSIYFTLPESLWERKRDFFRSFSFEYACRADRQYRLFDRELFAEASARLVLDAASERFFRANPGVLLEGRERRADLLISMKPIWANAVFSGRKTVEVRKTFARHWAHHSALIYSSAPQKSLVGHVELGCVHELAPSEAWDAFAARIGCSERDFFSYCGDRKVVSVIEIERAESWNRQIELAEARRLVGTDFRPPQSHARLDQSANALAML